MLKAFLRVSKLNNDLKVIKKGRKIYSKSFVKAFITILARQFAQNVSYATADYLGDNRSLGANHMPLFCNAGGGGGWWTYDYSSGATSSPTDSLGIVVGIGTGSVIPTDYSLGTKINHGTGTSQLLHFGHLIKDVLVTAPSASYDIERIFLNGSSAAINVTEIGVYAAHGGPPASNPMTYCILRDKLASPQTVANGEYLKVTYTIQITT